jgi:hypothetical protein
LAPVIALLVWKDKLSNGATDFLIDNTTASSAMHKISCKSFGVSALAFEFWKRATKMGAHAWIGEVRSKLNIADCPTRKARSDELKAALGDRLKEVPVSQEVRDEVYRIIGGDIDLALRYRLVDETENQALEVSAAPIPQDQVERQFSEDLFFELPDGASVLAMEFETYMSRAEAALGARVAAVPKDKWRADFEAAVEHERDRLKKG